MIIDALVSFVPLGSALAITNAAVPSNILDLLGSGVGTAPQNIIGTRTVFGEDAGIGVKKPLIQVNIGTAFSGGTSLNIAFQGAVDQGSGGSYQPGTWNTFQETGAIAAASLTTTQLIRLEFAPAFPQSTLPRFLRLLFTPVGTFTAGAIASAIVTMDRDDYSAKYAGRNYAVA